MAGQPLVAKTQSISRSAPASSHIIETLKEHLPAILRDHPVMLAYAHGSVVTGHTTLFSDVGIALVFGPTCELSPYQRFKTEISIGAEIERRGIVQDADVRSIDGAPLGVLGKVLTEGVLLYSRDEDSRVAYQVATWKRYFDFQPVLDMMRRAYFARLETELRENGLYD